MRKQNVMRILALVIVMVMMFSVASCNFGKKPAETTPQETTTTKAPEATSPQATEPQATEPAATEPAATEPAATEPAATEPAATEPAATEPAATEPAATEPAATEPAATEPAATEPVVTEPAATEPVVTEPAATEPVVTEPAVTEPAVTEPVEPGPGEPCETHDFGNRFEKKWGICVVCGYVDDNHEHSIKDGKCVYCDYEFEAIAVPSTFDNDNDGNMDVFYFSAALPEEFTGEDVIWLDAYNGSTGDHMTYDEIKAGSGTLPYPHVYCYDQKATDSIVLTLTVEKAGLYNVAAHYRIKDQKVRGAKFIANEGTEFEYAINHTYGWATADDAYECRNNDFLIGSYMTGIVLPLQAGENTITIRVADGVAKSQHFRDLYLAWAADLPAGGEEEEPAYEILSLDDAYAKGMACSAINAAGASTDVSYIKITLDDQVNPNGFGRGTLVANEKYISIAGGYLTGDAEGTLNKGCTVILRGNMGKTTSAKATAGENKGYEARMFNVELVEIISNEAPTA